MSKYLETKSVLDLLKNLNIDSIIEDKILKINLSDFNELESIISSEFYKDPTLAAFVFTNEQYETLVHLMGEDDKVVRSYSVPLIEDISINRIKKLHISHKKSDNCYDRYWLDLKEYGNQFLVIIESRSLIFYNKSTQNLIESNIDKSLIGFFDKDGISYFNNINIFKNTNLKDQYKFFINICNSESDGYFSDSYLKLCYSNAVNNIEFVKRNNTNIHILEVLKTYCKFIDDDNIFLTNLGIKFISDELNIKIENKDQINELLNVVNIIKY